MHPGLSRFVNGIIADRGSAKVVASVGLMLCAVANIIFGVSDLGANWIVVLAAKMGTTLTFSTVLIYCMGIVWVINGYLQGMGVPPFTKIMTQWIHPDQLATKMSVWNMSHSIGAGLAGIMFFWVLGKKIAEKEISKGREKPLPRYIIPLAKYVFCPLCILVLIAGAILGGIG